MHEPDRARPSNPLARAARLCAAVGLVVTVAGCGSGAGAESCTIGGGDGMLMINISGHDPGAVAVEGLAGVIETSDVVTLSAGPRVVTANYTLSLHDSLPILTRPG